MYLNRSRPLQSQSQTSDIAVRGGEPNMEATGVDVESAADALLHLFGETERHPFQCFVPILAGTDKDDEEVTVIQKKRKCC